MRKLNVSKPSTPQRRGRPRPEFVSSPRGMEMDTTPKTFVDDSCQIKKDHGRMMSDIKEGRELLAEVKSAAAAQIAMMDKMTALNSPSRREPEMTASNSRSSTSRISSPATPLGSYTAHYHCPMMGSFTAPPATCPPATCLPVPMPVYPPQSTDACHTIHRLPTGVMIDSSGHHVKVAPLCEMKTSSGEVSVPAGEEDVSKGNVVKAMYRQEGNKVEDDGVEKKMEWMEDKGMKNPTKKRKQEEVEKEDAPKL